MQNFFEEIGSIMSRIMTALGYQRKGGALIGCPILKSVEFLWGVSDIA